MASRKKVTSLAATLNKNRASAPRQQSVSEQVKNYKTRLNTVGVNPDEATDKRNALEKFFNVQEDQNVLFDVFEILGRPQQALFGAIESAQKGEDVLKGAWEGLKGDKYTYGGEILRNAGIGDDDKGEAELFKPSTWGIDDVAGTVLDIFADPMSIVPVKGFSAAAKAVKAGDKLSDAARLLRTGDDVVADIVKGTAKKGLNLGDNIITKTASKLDDIELNKAAKAAKRAGYGDDVTKFLQDNNLLTKVGNRADNYKFLKADVVDKFNQGATTLGKLKKSLRFAKGENDYLTKITDKFRKGYDNDVYDYILKKIDNTKFDAKDLDNLSKHISKGKDVNEWILKNSDSDLAKTLQKQYTDVNRNVTRFLEKDLDTSRTGKSTLNKLREKGFVDLDEKSAKEFDSLLRKAMNRSGVKLDYTVDLASNRHAADLVKLREDLAKATTKEAKADIGRKIKALENSGSTIRIANKKDLAKIQSNKELMDLFTDKKFTSDLKYNAKQLKEIDDMAADLDFSSLAGKHKDDYKKIAQLYKQATGTDLTSITREGYLTRARGNIVEDAAGKRPKSSKIFSGRKDIDTAENINRKYQESISRELEKLDKKIADKTSDLYVNKKAQLEKELSDLQTRANDIKFKQAQEGLNSTVEALRKGENRASLRSTNKQINDVLQNKQRLNDLTSSLDMEIANKQNQLANLMDNDVNVAKELDTLNKAKEVLQSKQGKEIFDLSYSAGLDLFLSNANMTNNSARLFKDSLMMGVFNDPETFIPVDKLKNGIIPKGFTEVDGKSLADKLHKIRTQIVDDTSDLFSNDALDAIENHLRNGKFVADERTLNLFKTLTEDKNTTKGFLNLMDGINNAFKKFSTLTPGFQVRNWLGNSTNMYLSGMNLKDIPKYQAKATQVLNSAEDIFRKLQDNIELTDIEKANADLLFEFHKGGFNNAGTAIRDLEAVEKSIKVGGKGPLNKATEINTWLNNKTDGINRMAVLMYANENPNYLKRLGAANPIEAVKYTMMDPSNLSEFERNVVKKIIPFYTFTKQNLMFQATNIAKNTPKYKRLIKSMNQMYDNLPEDSYYDYQKENMQIPIPWSDENGNQMFLKANLPLSDLGEWLSNPKQRVVSSTSPIIKTLIEAATGVDTFTGQASNKTTTERILTGLGLQNVTTNVKKKVDAIVNAYNGDMDNQAMWAEIFRSVLQNTNEENVRNVGLYDEMQEYQAIVKDLKNQGIDVPTMTEINKGNRVRLNRLKRKRASK